eukprot:g11957.t1
MPSSHSKPVPVNPRPLTEALGDLHSKWPKKSHPLYSRCGRGHASTEHRAFDAVLAQYLLDERFPPLEYEGVGQQDAARGFLQLKSIVEGPRVLDGGCFSGPGFDGVCPGAARALKKKNYHTSSTAGELKIIKRVKLGIDTAACVFAQQLQDLVLAGVFDAASFA